MGRDGVHENRDPLISGAIARKFRAAARNHAQVAALLPDGHFSVDRTLSQGVANMTFGQGMVGRRWHRAAMANANTHGEKRGTGAAPRPQMAMSGWIAKDQAHRPSFAIGGRF
jgi:hypothetical protein